MMADDDDLPTGERLQKVLARAGIGSRRAIERYIEDEFVMVNGEVAVLGRRVDADKDVIVFDGTIISTRTDLVHYLLHKPRLVMSTTKDPEGRRTVLDLVPDDERVFPVGRLDYETEGLLILTNNGDLTHRLTHPSFGVEKEYLVHVEGIPGRGSLRTLRQGVELEDGITAPARVSNAAPDLLKIVIHEGRNRQIRRMCEAVGHPVKRLVRTRIGPLTDLVLKAGEWRNLTTEEVRALERATTVEDD